MIDNATSRPGINDNDCLVTDNLVSGARNLIQGSPLTPIHFADLCNLIETVVLHERIIMTLPSLDRSPLRELVDKGVITFTVFKATTPSSEADRAYVKRITETCLRTLSEGSIFGRGLMNLNRSRAQELEFAVYRLVVGDAMLRLDMGMKPEPGAEQEWNEIRRVYSIFKDYADSVFEAAGYFHVNAYTGTSETHCAIQNTLNSVPRALYNKLREIHQDRVNAFLAETGFRAYDIPPFASIILSRCKSRDDIVPQLLAGREEFTAFRETCTRYATDLRQAATCGTHEDIIRLHNDLDQAIALLTKKAKASDKDSRIAYRVWDIVKEGTPWGIARNLLDYLKQYDVDRQTLWTVNGLLDVWSKLKKASSYERILRSNLFPGEFREADFALYQQYIDRVRSYLPVQIKG